jgi:hypothetical protein
MTDLHAALAIMAEWKKHQPTAEQILGSPPWDRERLEKAYFADFRQVWDLLEKHPAHELFDFIECLTRSFALFDVCVRDLIAAIGRFQVLYRERGLPARQKQTAFDEVKLDLEKNLFAATQAALALVDHSRRISGKVAIPGYPERTTTFGNDPAHRFLQGLRVCLFHVFYISPNWELRMDATKGEKARFLISKKDLLRFGEWTPLARQFLDSLGEALDLESFLRDYREKVRTFQSWFVTQLRHHNPESLANYLETRRTLHAIGAKTWWNILLTQVVIQGGRDAYDYLDRFLVPTELERVYALPFHSKEQVDAIIALVDEHGACDTSLRQTAYRAFKVAMPNDPAGAATTTSGLLP